MESQTLTIQTSKKDEVIDITNDVQEILQKNTEQKTLCHLFLLHTSAALTTADLDPGTDLDILNALRNIIPELNYRHAHDPKHVPDHILSTIIGTSLTVPITKNSLELGDWQQIILIELNGPKKRTIRITMS